MSMKLAYRMVLQMQPFLIVALHGEFPENQPSGCSSGKWSVKTRLIV